MRMLERLARIVGILADDRHIPLNRVGPSWIGSMLEKPTARSDDTSPSCRHPARFLRVCLTAPW
jgi:hypothetical protein